jgi:hypothetical protein
VSAEEAPRPRTRPRDALGRPLPWGSPTAIEPVDYARLTYAQNIEAGRSQFNAGRFFEAHEAWEEAWRQALDPAAREFCRGLAQLGAAYTHVARGNAVGARALFARALPRLAAPPPRVGLDLAGAVPVFAEQMAACERAAAAGSPPPLLDPPAI